MEAQIQPTGAPLQQRSTQRTATPWSTSPTIPSYLVRSFVLGIGEYPTKHHVCNRYYILRQVVIQHTPGHTANPRSTGDWAGNSYATSGCEGTCEERLMNPNNFVVSQTTIFSVVHSTFTWYKNANWNINSLKVYRKQPFRGQVNSAVRIPHDWRVLTASLSIVVLAGALMMPM
jgi:hypothetical protein